jgi:hypothetical protein
MKVPLKALIFDHAKRFVDRILMCCDSQSCAVWMDVGNVVSDSAPTSIVFRFSLYLAVNTFCLGYK